VARTSACCGANPGFTRSAEEPHIAHGGEDRVSFDLARAPELDRGSPLSETAAAGFLRQPATGVRQPRL
jgi:hypothetical protein